MDNISAPIQHAHRSTVPTLPPVSVPPPASLATKPQGGDEQMPSSLPSSSPSSSSAAVAYSEPKRDDTPLFVGASEPSVYVLADAEEERKIQRKIGTRTAVSTVIGAASGIGAYSLMPAKTPYRGLKAFGLGLLGSVTSWSVWQATDPLSQAELETARSGQAARSGQTSTVATGTQAKPKK